ncbi:MAG: hypothetical protein ACR2H3_02260 [Acidimicrobiales bacterium]
MLRRVLPITALILLAGCGALVEEDVTGEIRDDAIDLEVDTSHHSIWLELTNAGTIPCELGVVLTDAPHGMPVVDGRADLGSATDPEAERYPMLAYTEIDGVVVPSEGNLTVTVPPGSVARLQLGFIGIPDRGEMVILCNDPGDYEAGRYAVLRFNR